MEETTGMGGRKRRVLVVDDDQSIRAMVARYLHRGGFEVTEAGDAAQALLEARKQPRPFDLVLTDVHMPGISGIELARMLLSGAPLNPVVVMTGDHDESLAREAIARGASGYLLKPFELFQLDAAVRQALSHLELVEATDSTAGEELTDPADAVLRAGQIPAVWLRLADERSGAGSGHAYRVARIAGALGNALSDPLSAEERKVLDLAARGHELGRLLGPDDTLPELAARTAAFLAELGLDAEVARTVRYMHEQWDGGGGPEGLSGEGIPRACRVLAAADAVDHRAANQANTGATPEDAIASAVNLIVVRSGTTFAPEVAEALEESRDTIEAIWILARSGAAAGR